MALTLAEAIARLQSLQREAPESRVLIEVLPAARRVLSPPRQPPVAKSTDGTAGAERLNGYEVVVSRESRLTHATTEATRSNPRSVSPPRGQAADQAAVAHGPWKHSYHVPLDAFGSLKPAPSGPVAEADAARRELSVRRAERSPSRLQGTASPARADGRHATSGTVPVYRYDPRDFAPEGAAHVHQPSAPQERLVSPPPPPPSHRQDRLLSSPIDRPNESPARRQQPPPLPRDYYHSRPSERPGRHESSASATDYATSDVPEYRSSQPRQVSPPRRFASDDAYSSESGFDERRRLDTRSRGRGDPRYDYSTTEEDDRYDVRHRGGARPVPSNRRSVSPPRGRGDTRFGALQDYSDDPSASSGGHGPRYHVVVSSGRHATTPRTHPNPPEGASRSRSQTPTGTPRGKRAYSHVQSSIRRPPPVDTRDGRGGFFAFNTAAPGSDAYNTSPRRRNPKGVAWVV
jgi:hypothetical protein